MPNSSRTSPLRRIYAVPRRSRGAFFAISLTIMIEASFRVLLPLSVGFIVDEALLAHNANQFNVATAVLGAGLLAAFLAGILCDRVYSRLVASFLANMRQTMYERIQKLSLSFHQQADSEAILGLFSRDLSRIEDAFATAVSWGVLPGATALLCSLLMCWLDWRVGALALLFWPWALLFPRATARYVAEAAKESRKQRNLIRNSVEESLSARQVVRTFSLEQTGISLFRKRNSAVTKSEMRTRLRVAVTERFRGTGVLSIQLMVLLFSGWLSLNFGLAPGAAVSLLLLAIILAGSLTMCAEYFPTLEQGRKAWEKIQVDLAESEPVLDKADAAILPPLQRCIEFSDVTCRSLDRKTSLDGVTLRIPRGTSAAFVGESDSGNSLPLALLLRFHDPDSGAVLIDGLDLKNITQASLHSRIGVVLRDNFVFDASLRDNIRLGHSESSEEALNDIARAAGLLQDLETMAGSNGISRGGEAVQRLALARTLLRNPEVVLLDDVASVLDAPQEQAFNATIRELTRGRTVVWATHRLTSVADAGQISFFERGKIVEQGTHSELLAMNGYYTRLWRKQSGFHFSADGGHVDIEGSRLQQFPVFDKLPQSILEEVALYFATETFPADRDIVRQNDPGDKFYVIVRGTAEAWRTEELSGETSTATVLQDGDFFGEITLITSFPRTVTVRTKTMCTCISLERAQFERVIERYPKFHREIMETAVQRLRQPGKAIARSAV